MKRSLWILAIFFSSIVTVNAQQTLSLEEAVHYAIEHNKELKISRKNVDLYKEKVREAISQGLPQINGSVNYSTNFGEKLDFGGVANKLEDQAAFNATVNQLIFSGEWILGIKTSKIAERMNEQQVDLTRLDITENVYNSYYTILVVDRTLEILHQNLENMESVLKHTENMFAAGVAESTDVDQIKINVGQLKNSLLSMERTLDLNYNLLRIQLGLTSGTELTLSDKLGDFLHLGNFTTLAAQAFDIEQNSQYALAITQEELKTKMVGLKKWAFAPSVAANYAYKYQIKEGGFLNVPHTANITVNIPVFSGLQRKAALNQSKIELEQAEISKALLDDQLNLQDDQLKYDLKNAIENYNLQKSNIDVAKRVLDNFKHKYEQGVASSLDLTQANNNYLQAENNYNNACLALLQAQVKIEKLYNTLHQ